MGTEPTFVEERPLRRGLGTLSCAGIGVVILGIVLLFGGLWTWQASVCFAVAGALLVVPVFVTVVTEVIVWADHLVPLFGGWNTRGSLVAAMATTVEGDRWRPHALAKAVEEAQART